MAHSLLIVYTLLFIAYSTGLVITKFTGRFIFSEGFWSIFQRILLGTIGIITFYALAKTGFNSVHWGFALLGVIFLVKKRESGNAPPTSLISFKQHGIYMAFVPALFVGIFSLYYYKHPVNHILHFDDVYYAYASAKLGFFGFETTDPILLGNNYMPATPYHYFELWMADLISAVSGVSHMESFSVIVKSYLLTVLAIGMLALTSIFTQKTIFRILSIMAVFISPILVDYENVKQAACNAHQAKTMLSAIFVLWGLMLLIRKSANWQLPFLAMPILSVTFAPIVYTVLFTMNVYDGIKKRSAIYVFMKSKDIFIVALFLLLFYGLQSKTNPFEEKMELAYLLPLINARYFLGLLTNYSKLYILYFVYAIPFLTILFLSVKQNRVSIYHLSDKFNLKAVLLLMGFSIVLGMGLEILFSPLLRENSAQLNALFNNPLVSVLLFIAFLLSYILMKEIYSRLTIFPIVFSAVVILYGFAIFVETRTNFSFPVDSTQKSFDPRSVEYIQSVSRHFKGEHEKHLGGIIMSDEEIQASGKISSMSDVMNSYWFTPYSTSMDMYYLVNLSVLEKTVQTVEVEKYNLSDPVERENYWWAASLRENISKTPLHYFYETKQNTDPKITPHEAREAFIREHRLRFLIVRKNALLPADLDAAVDTFYVDKLSGEHFYLLKHDK